jgi:uncharacterized membrane protein
MHTPDPRAEAMDLWTRRITRWVTGFARWFSDHWLSLFDLAMALWAGLPFLAPVLAHSAHPRAAQLLYWLFQPLCHQMPERSFFLFGGRWTYSYEQLSQLLGGVAVPQRWIGQAGIGFKAAVCERDVAVYGFALLAGLVFALVRRRLKPLPLKAFGLLILPMAIDGLGQLVGLWTSTWLSRIITGALFGVSCVWLAFPYVERGMVEVRRETDKALQEQRI